MLMEGTGKYFLILFLVFLIVYIAVKISLGFLLKRAKEKSWKAYVPIYTTLVIVDLLNLNRRYFYLSLIPFANLYYYYIIIKELLKGFNENPNEAIWYVALPMYNFPKLAFKRPKFVLNEYDLTEEFINIQNALFEKPEEVIEPVIQQPVQNITESVQQPSQNLTSAPQMQTDYNQITPVNSETNNEPMQAVGKPAPQQEESVFTNENLKPDETHTTYVEVKEEPKEEKPIITPVNNGRPKMCPKCGARLSPDAEVCFLCGTNL